MNLISKIRSVKSILAVYYMIREKLIEILNGEKNNLYLAIRWSLFVGFAFRLALFWRYANGNLQEIFFALNALCLLIFLGYLLVLSYLVYSGKARESWMFFTYQVVFDLAIFTSIYILSARPQSDTFLAFFLPLLIVAENARKSILVKSFLLIALVLTISIIVAENVRPILNVRFDQSITMVPNNAIRIFFGDVAPRLFSFLFFTLVVVMRSIIFQRQAEEINVINETLINIPKARTFEDRLNAVLEDAKKLLNGDAAVIYRMSSDGESLKIVALQGVTHDTFKVDYRLEKGSGVAWEAVDRQDTVIENEYPFSEIRVAEFSNLFQAAIMTPLFLERKAIGILGVYHLVSRKRFSERDKKILIRLAAYVAVSIYDQEQIDKQIKFLTNASRSNTIADIDMVMADIARRSFGMAEIDNSRPSIVGIGLIDHEAGQGEPRLRFRAAYPLDQLEQIRHSFEMEERPGGRIGVTGRTLREKKVQYVPDVHKDTDYLSCFCSTNTELSVPIKSTRGNVLGVISIENPDKNAFSDQMINSVEIIADQASSSVENSRLVADIKLKNNLETRLREASAKVLSSPLDELEKVGLAVLAGLTHLIDCERCLVYKLLDGEANLIAEQGYGYGKHSPPIAIAVRNPEFISRIFDGRTPRFIADIRAVKHLTLFAMNSERRPWGCISLLAGSAPFGLIVFEGAKLDVYNAQDTGNVISIFADFATTFLQNSILYADNKQQAIEQERLNGELTANTQYLKSLINDSAGMGNLALIGLVYGESIHFAADRLGLAKTLVADVQEDAEKMDREMIKDNMEKARGYIDNYLESLRNAQKVILPPSEETNVESLIKGVIRVKRYSSHVQVHYDLAEVDHRVVAPPQQLRQVFFVVVQNAFEAMHSRSKKELKISTAAFDDSSDFLIVSITDTGIGIPTEKQRALFDPKDSNEDHHRGSGIGLPWARSFLRSYGGDMTFDSSVAGTTMHIKIPADFRKDFRLRKKNTIVRR